MISVKGNVVYIPVHPEADDEVDIARKVAQKYGTKVTYEGMGSHYKTYKAVFKNSEIAKKFAQEIADPEFIRYESASMGSIRKFIREIIQEEIHVLVEGLKKLNCAWVSPSGRQYKCACGSKNARAHELTNFKFGSLQKAAKALEDRGWTWKQNIKI